MRARLLLAVLLLAGAACSSSVGSRPAGPAATATPRQLLGTYTYVAIGASESAGVGTADPPRQSFPQQLYQRMGPGSVLYDLGLPGETTAAALKDELPTALAVHPTLATVWLNVDDLIAGVPVADYESRLDQVVGALHRAGTARILVANTPQLERLPAYAACRPNPPPGSPACLLSGVTLPPPDQVIVQVRAYDDAIARVVEREHATLVDLNAGGAGLDAHPDYVSADGFHPSSAGAAAIADAFAQALERT